MRVNIISLAALATTVAGLTVTSPRIGEKIDPDMPLTIKWQAVTTDPETFSIELVNQNVYPPTTTIVADDIDSSKGSYTVKAKTFTDVDNGKGYQINFLSPQNGILAQSQQFRVTEPGEIASEASASSSGKETSTALETSLISSASTSDITSALSSTASSYLSSTATHSSISVSTPTSYYSTASSSISTPTTSSLISSSAISTSVSALSSTSLSTATHSSTTSTTTRKNTSTTTSTATESASTTSNAAAVLMPPAGSLLLGLFALVL
ncbi:hypothetical protein VN97_g10691 [Penicillium thymicola]|uniref:Yeast cell wall synthesis Kre9/Knh1-like N-terminal domain-containing protein n=1 Tax=Penicillium thymicola TaxID=293382 RepID=A0AAI9X460_PENTH|nr:hypothetical protein VN97_g10691 [Penicillium thymicola]